ncbi:MAG: hypothetical protein ABL949_08050 [Fimbriimonadaceae bacterium]
MKIRAFSNGALAISGGAVLSWWVSFISNPVFEEACTSEAFGFPWVSRNYYCECWGQGGNYEFHITPMVLNALFFTTALFMIAKVRSWYV